jgi:hypothetical protein
MVFRFSDEVTARDTTPLPFIFLRILVGNFPSRFLELTKRLGEILVLRVDGVLFPADWARLSLNILAAIDPCACCRPATDRARDGVYLHPLPFFCDVSPVALVVVERNGYTSTFCNFIEYGPACATNA